MEREGDFQSFLAPTSIIDSDHPDVAAFARMSVGHSVDPVERAVKLYLAVRDSIRYDPYTPFHLPEHYRASRVLKRGRGFCIPKASLLCACARSMGIPSRPFVELHLDGKWVKATPAFNRELCERHRVPPLEFDGHEDSVFQPYNLENQKYMEYEGFLGSYADVPVAEIVSAWESTYGKERVSGWIRQFSETDGRAGASFEKEEVLQT